VLSTEPGPTGLYNCKGCGAEIEASAVVPVSIAPVELPQSKPAPQLKQKRPPPEPRELPPRPAGFIVTERADELWLEWEVARGASATVGWAVLLTPILVLALVSRELRSYAWIVGGALVTTLVALVAGLRRQSQPKRAALRLGNELIVARDVELDPAVLAQVYVREVEHHYTTHSRVSGRQEHVRYTYDVRAKRKNGEHLTLVEDAGSLNLALHLEREIEKRYKIRDERVLYEVPR
jgi:hypothetical protein